MDFGDDEDMEDDVLAELGLYGEISEADIEAERQRILSSDQIGPEILDFDEPSSPTNDENVSGGIKSMEGQQQRIALSIYVNSGAIRALTLMFLQWLVVRCSSSKPSCGTPLVISSQQLLPAMAHRLHRPNTTPCSLTLQQAPQLSP
jgi:hypothetical protein